MKVQNGTCSDVRVAYIGGGSHGWAWTFFKDLAREEKMSGIIDLYDIDRPMAEQNAEIGTRLFKRLDVKGNWKFEVSGSLKELLEKKPEFVIISILPGTFDHMASDVHLPEKYGIYQSVGDTAGPGGLVRALRTIPMFVEIAEAIKEYCPETLVINYTNPMTLCVKTLYRVFPQIKAFGCCHEVFGTQKILRDMYQLATGETDVERDEVIVNVQGINHFTWFDRASCRGVDLFPIYRKFIDEHFEDGYHDPDRNWMNGTFNCAHRVKMDLFNKYGNIAAAGDRHLAEFLPGDVYLRDPEQVHQWTFYLTPVSWRKERQAEKIEEAKRLASGEEELKLEATGEEGILLMKALCGLNRMVSNVNIPNTAGQIPNLPRTAVVETNAVFYRGTIQPIFAGEMKPVIRDLVMPHVENHERILEAAMKPNFGLAYEAFMNDPLVHGRISREDGEKLLKEMIQNTLDVLPEGWKKEIQ